MPRPQRIEFENACYHITNRGQGRRAVFHNGPYYEAFLATLAEAHQRFGLEVHAYCLLPQQYHLLIRTPRGNLSRCMRHVNGLYTQRYNRLRNTDGPLFRGRFKAVLIDQDAYLLKMSRFVHRVPVDTKRALVKQLDQHPWSSYLAYINTSKPPGWLYREASYALLGHSQKYRRYRQYIDSGTDAEILQFYGRGKLSPILGTEKFKATLAGKNEPNVASNKQPKSSPNLPSMDDIVSAVTDRLSVEPQHILTGVRGRRNEPRWIAIYLSHSITDQPLAEIAGQFNISHISGVSQVINRLNKEMEDNNQLSKHVKILTKKLAR